MMIYIFLDPRCQPEDLGFIPGFLNEEDKRPAREQLDSNYQHGGGWSPMDKFTMDPATGIIQYPGDPKLKPYAMTSLHDERIYFYRHGFVAIVQSDSKFEVARMD